MQTLKEKAQAIIDSIDACEYKPSDQVAWYVEDYILTPGYDNDTLTFYDANNCKLYEGEDVIDILCQILDINLAEYLAIDGNSTEKLIDDNQDLYDDIETIGVWQTYEYRMSDNYPNMFLTREGAERFLNANAHHFHSKARIVNGISWRNNEMITIVKILREFIK